MRKEVPGIIKDILQVRFGIRLGFTGSYLVMIVVLSLLSVDTFEDIPSFFEHMDKVVHFLMYGVLSAVLCWTFSRKNYKPVVYFALVVLFCVSYGVIMEILQGIFKELERSFSWADVTANVLGAIIFIPVKELLLPAALDRYWGR